MTAAAAQPHTATVLGQLRSVLNGQNGPVNVQALWVLLHALPTAICRNPGSREFRRAQQAYWESIGMPLDLTRRDIASAIAYLNHRGLLPPWINAEEPRAWASSW